MVLVPMEVHLSSERAYRPQGSMYYNDCTFSELNISAPFLHALYVSVVNLTIPHTFLPVNSSNNSISIDGFTYNIPSGNYSIMQLISTLTSTLALEGVAITYDRIAMRVTVSSSTSMTVGGPLCSALGITEGSQGTSISSSLTVDMCGVRSIYMLTDSLQTRNLDTRAGNVPIICRVPVTEAPGSIISYTPTVEPGFYISDGELQTLHILLQDHNRQPLQASLPWECTLRITYIPTGQQYTPREPPTDLIASYME